MKCNCGKTTSNLSGICSKCLTGPATPKPKKPKKPKPTEAPPKRRKCPRCTLPTDNATGECDTCINTDKNRKCPRCGGPMEIRMGYLGAFWGCIRFPNCEGTITARGTHTRKFDRA